MTLPPLRTDDSTQLHSTLTQHSRQSVITQSSVTVVTLVRLATPSAGSGECHAVTNTIGLAGLLHLARDSRVTMPARAAACSLPDATSPEVPTAKAASSIKSLDRRSIVAAPPSLTASPQAATGSASCASSSDSSQRSTESCPSNAAATACSRIRWS